MTKIQQKTYIKKLRICIEKRKQFSNRINYLNREGRVDSLVNLSFSLKNIEFLQITHNQKYFESVINNES